MLQPKYRSVDELVEDLPANERKVVELLRQIILDSIPDGQEKLSYGVPFYYRFSRICYIWPASIPWGNVKLEGVALGFCKGHLLSENDYLEKANRKEVHVKTFFSPADIDINLVKSFLYEAVEVDEATAPKKKGNKS